MFTWDQYCFGLGWFVYCAIRQNQLISENKGNWRKLKTQKYFGNKSVVKLNNSWFPVAIFMALNLAKIFITITITISQYHKNRDIDLKCKTLKIKLKETIP